MGVRAQLTNSVQTLPKCRQAKRPLQKGSVDQKVSFQRFRYLTNLLMVRCQLLAPKDHLQVELQEPIETMGHYLFVQTT